MSDAAEAADQLLSLVGAGEGGDAQARSPDADALLACFEACRAWLEKAQVCYAIGLFCHMSRSLLTLTHASGSRLAAPG